MQRIDNHFFIQNHNVLDLCQQYGTPLYVYDLAIIEQQYHRLLSAFGNTHVRIKYACKALSNQNILRFMHRLGAGLDTVSIYEVQKGLLAGFAPSDIIFTPNCVSMTEIQQAVELGVMINIDNLSILEQFGQQYGNTVPVCVRLNPHIMAGGNHKISTGHVDSKFGISVYQMRHLQRIIEQCKLHVTGLHVHTGSDILDIEVFMRGAEILLDAAQHFPDLTFIDFGSGFKVPYRPSDVGTDIEALAAQLVPRFDEFCQQYGRPLQMQFEPGKFLVSQAGYFFAKVNVVKQTPATIFAGLDTGFNHLIRPMFYDAYHHITNISYPQGIMRFYTVVGYICETDTFAIDRRLNEVNEGDILCFANAGAYCFEMASNYNSRVRPAEVMIYQNKSHLIRRRETLNDLLQTQINVLL
jgi:diaminopimelate decarboxylase